jgi:hypothetical protein
MAREQIKNIMVETPVRPVHEADEDVNADYGTNGHAGATLPSELDDLGRTPYEAFLASIRDRVRSFPESRHEEIFKDFEEAVQSRDIGILADVVANWAQGGHGYYYSGVRVNKLIPVITEDTDEEVKKAWDAFWDADEPSQI